MTYGGIYRDVRLEVKEKVSLSDIFVHTAIDFRSSPVTAQITSEITLTESDENVTIRQYYMPKSTAAGILEAFVRADCFYGCFLRQGVLPHGNHYRSSVMGHRRS